MDSAILQELSPFRLDEQPTSAINSSAGIFPAQKRWIDLASASRSPSRVSIVPLTLAFRPSIVSSFVRRTTNWSFRSAVSDNGKVTRLISHGGCFVVHRERGRDADPGGQVHECLSSPTCSAVCRWKTDARSSTDVSGEGLVKDCSYDSAVYDPVVSAKCSSEMNNCCPSQPSARHQEIHEKWWGLTDSLRLILLREEHRRDRQLPRTPQRSRRQ